MIDQDGQTIEIGDTVYENRRGWSGVPMRVLEFRRVRAANGGMLNWAVCKVGQFAGSFSNKHNCYVCSFNVDDLTHEPNRRGK
jgi:hypothetical protein